MVFKLTRPLSLTEVTQRYSGIVLDIFCLIYSEAFQFSPLEKFVRFICCLKINYIIIIDGQGYTFKSD